MGHRNNNYYIRKYVCEQNKYKTVVDFYIIRAWKKGACQY